MKQDDVLLASLGSQNSELRFTLGNAGVKQLLTKVQRTNSNDAAFTKKHFIYLQERKFRTGLRCVSQCLELIRFFK